MAHRSRHSAHRVEHPCAHGPDRVLSTSLMTTSIVATATERARTHRPPVMSPVKIGPPTPAVGLSRRLMLGDSRACARGPRPTNHSDAGDHSIQFRLGHMTEALIVLKDWFMQWVVPGDLGDVIPWLFALVMGVLTFRASRLKARREQALQISAWIDEDIDGSRIARVRNSSRLPIDRVLVMVARPRPDGPNKEDWESNGQMFPASGIGPERSADFPIAPTIICNQQPLIRLYFRDYKRMAWILNENGQLKKQKRSVSPAFHTGIGTGQRSSMTDHSGILGSDNQPVRLADADIVRLDLDQTDGNNITVSFVPKGEIITPESVAELTKGALHR